MGSIFLGLCVASCKKHGLFCPSNLKSLIIITSNKKEGEKELPDEKENAWLILFFLLLNPLSLSPSPSLLLSLIYAAIPPSSSSLLLPPPPLFDRKEEKLHAWWQKGRKGEKGRVWRKKEKIVRFSFFQSWPISPFEILSSFTPPSSSSSSFSSSSSSSSSSSYLEFAIFGMEEAWNVLCSKRWGGGRKERELRSNPTPKAVFFSFNFLSKLFFNF